MLIEMKLHHTSWDSPNFSIKYYVASRQKEDSIECKFMICVN